MKHRDECAAHPYEMKLGRRIPVDTSKVAAYMATLKYVDALMIDGTVHTLSTSLVKLEKAHPSLVRVRRDTLVVKTKVTCIERIPESRRRKVTLQGGWTITTARANSTWRQLTGEKRCPNSKLATS